MDFGHLSMIIYTYRLAMDTTLSDLAEHGQIIIRTSLRTLAALNYACKVLMHGGQNLHLDGLMDDFKLDFNGELKNQRHKGLN